MPDKAIVGFIDILGYKLLVERFMDKPEIIRGIENVIKNTFKKLKESLPTNNPYSNKIRDAIIDNDAINVRIISDTILFTLSFAKINEIKPSPQDAEKQIKADCIHCYFRFINIFCLLFIKETGHVLRGGISIGSHYEKEFSYLGNSLFIFSKTYLKAYELEEKANTARIIIDKDLSRYLDELFLNESAFNIDKFFYEDEDGEKCFEFYSFLKHNDLSKKWLTNIKEGLSVNFKQCVNDIGDPKKLVKVLVKLIYFAKYHNKKVSKDDLNFESLIIDTSDFEKIVLDS